MAILIHPVHGFFPSPVPEGKHMIECIKPCQHRCSVSEYREYPDKIGQNMILDNKITYDDTITTAAVIIPTRNL